MLAPTARALRSAGIVAIAAALLATLSDLTLVWVSVASAGAVPAPPPGITRPATYVGALAILCYAVGYWQVACGLLGAGERVARRVFLLGAAMAGVGAVIHGMTGLTLHYEAQRGGDLSPAHVIVSLLPLWLLGLACGGVATTEHRVRHLLRPDDGRALRRPARRRDTFPGVTWLPYPHPSRRCYPPIPC